MSVRRHGRRWRQWRDWILASVHGCSGRHYCSAELALTCVVRASHRARVIAGPRALGRALRIDCSDRRDRWRLFCGWEGIVVVVADRRPMCRSSKRRGRWLRNHSRFYRGVRKYHTQPVAIDAHHFAQEIRHRSASSSFADMAYSARSSLSFWACREGWTPVLGRTGRCGLSNTLTAVFVVHHEYQRDDDRDEIKLIGVYSTEAKAKLAIERL